MKLNRIRSFFQNTDAYIPFAIIGIFIVLAAALTSAYLIKMDYEVAQTIYDTDKINLKQTAVNLASADLSRCLNYAGMEALKWQGEHPIIQPEGTQADTTSNDGFIVRAATRDLESGDPVMISITLPRDVWGRIESLWSDKEIEIVIRDSSGEVIGQISYGESLSALHRTELDESFTIPESASSGFGSIELRCGQEVKATDWITIGTSPIKDITAHHVNGMIAQNYQGNLHTFNRYAINVVPDIKPSDIAIHKVNGTLEKQIDQEDNVYTICYTLSIEGLNYTLVDLQTNETFSSTMDISTLITSREPLLAELVSEYESSLNSAETSNIVLGATNIRTLAYGPWQHYGNGPLNILTNPALSGAVNAGTLYSQKKVFDSVDPWAMMYTTYHNGKVLYQDVHGDGGMSDCNTSGINGSINVSDAYDNLSSESSFSIDLMSDIGISMADSGTDMGQVSEDSKITVSASDYTQGAIDGWVFNDQQWPGSNDLLHDITREVYSAGVQAQVIRDGFDRVEPLDATISADRGSSSHGSHSVSWYASYETSGTHSGALVSSYDWEDGVSNSYLKSVSPSIDPPKGRVTSWQITSASVSLMSFDITDVSVKPVYDCAGGDNITEVSRTDGYLDWEKHRFNWNIGYRINYKIKTQWKIDYSYAYTYKWKTFEGYRDPVNKTGKIYGTHYGTDSGSDSTTTSKTDSESLSHTETEAEYLTVIYHKRPPTGGYSGLSTYSDPIKSEYGEKTVYIDGIQRIDPCCSDAADKYSSRYVDIRDIGSKYWLFPHGFYMAEHTVQCDVPEWIHKVMADEVLGMVDSIESDDPSVGISLIDNIGKDPSELRLDAAEQLVCDLESSREEYVETSMYYEGSDFGTSSDAARFIASNEAYNKLIYDIEGQNRDLNSNLDSYVFKMLEKKGIDVPGLDNAASGSLSILNNPAVSMAGKALGSEMGLMTTIQITGEPGSKYNWTEDMTLVVDQYPDYLYHDPEFDLRGEYELKDPKGRTIYPLGVRNTCVFSTGISEDIASALEGSMDFLKTSMSRQMSQSIYDLNGEVVLLEQNLSQQSVNLDTSDLDMHVGKLKRVYSSQMRINIPGEVASQISADPVVSDWIESEEVKFIVSGYLDGLSDGEIIKESTDDTLSDEISEEIMFQIRSSNPPIAEDELDAVLCRVDTDVRIGVAEGISVVIIDNKDLIDGCFEGINSELQSMMGEVSSYLSEKAASKVSKRLERTMKMVPSGLPVIPPNWVFTINVWTYDVVGKYHYFRIVDNDNEVIFDPYFGHTGQEYVRQKDIVYHPFKKNKNGYELRLGSNQPIFFKFSGYAATVVGSGPKGVGDKTGGRTEKSTGYDDLLNEFGV